MSGGHLSCKHLHSLSSMSNVTWTWFKSLENEPRIILKLVMVLAKGGRPLFFQCLNPSDVVDVVMLWTLPSSFLSETCMYS